MKKKIWIAAICILAVSLGVGAFLSRWRAGGEIGFDAVVTSVEGDLVFAAVTADDAGFGSRKLPETIVIYGADFPEMVFRVGDLIHGCYLRKAYEGNFYRVVSIVVAGADFSPNPRLSVSTADCFL